MKPEQIKKVNWQKIEDNRNIHLFPVMLPGWTTIIENSRRIIGLDQKSILCIHQGNLGSIYGKHQEWLDLGEYILNKILKDIKWGQKANARIVELADKLNDFSGKLYRKNFSRLTARELIKDYINYEKYHSELYHYAIIPVFLDLYQPHLSDYLTKYLEKKLGAQKSSEAFGILTTPDKASKVRIEEIKLIRLALAVKNDQNLKTMFADPDFDSKKMLAKKNSIIKNIIKHHQEFGYQGYNWEGPVFSLDYFIKRIKELIAADPEKLLAESDHYYAKIKKLKRQYLKNCGIDKKHEQLFDLTCDFIHSKDYRKDCLVKSYWHIEPLIFALAKKLYLSPSMVRSLTIEELKKIAKGANMSKDQLSRQEQVVYAVLNSNLPGTIFTGDQAGEIIDHIKKQEKHTAQKDVSGQVAYPGVCRGRVIIVEHPKDILQMKKGDILVAHMTNPDLVPGMKIAGAIVTETGGITCHAAIVSRELKKPCVIGTKIATRIFTDGDMVEVDANKGIVKKIK